METVGTTVAVLENVMSLVAHLDSVELYVTDAIKKGVDFDWIRSASCSFHYQGIEDGIVTGVIRISVPWWCKQKNRMMIIIIVIFINCNWVVSRWQWLF